MSVKGSILMQLSDQCLPGRLVLGMILEKNYTCGGRNHCLIVASCRNHCLAEASIGLKQGGSKVVSAAGNEQQAGGWANYLSISLTFVASQRVEF